MSSAYEDFLKSKQRRFQGAGFDMDTGAYPFLYDFQARMLSWSCSKGRSAIFADCGLGKTPLQLAWADSIARKSDKPVLIFAPLAVSHQTQREGEKFGIPVNIARESADIRPGVNITNYEKLEHFTPVGLGGIVLDESSILKSYGGKTRQLLTDFAQSIEYRLCCTATPAPNDLIEICNHAEFLGVLNSKEIIALFFRQDGNTTHEWRLKGHAKADFWKWLASWAMAVRKPSDLGFDDGRFTLQPLNIVQHTVDGHIAEGVLFPIEALTLQEQAHARRESLYERVGRCAAIVNDSADPWVVWCNLNCESEALKAAIPGAVEVTGSDSDEHKTTSMLGFSAGQFRVIISKPSICGWGMNWQHCHNMAFTGLSHSFEQFYQAIRRCYRFGQTKPVTAHVIVAETEGAVRDNIHRKEIEVSQMMEELVRHIGSEYNNARDDGRYKGAMAVGVPSFLKRCV